MNWERVIEKIREKTKEGRKLEYSPDAIGITALLYCPLKWELRKKYPEIEAQAVEVDDGFLWEKQVKEVLKELFSNNFEEEKVLRYQTQGIKLEGHLDAFVEFPEKVVGIELKSPRMVFLKEFPETNDTVLYDDGKVVVMNEIYLLQAKIQKFLLEKLYPHKKVQQFIFAKTLCKKANRSKKFYIIYEVKGAISEEEFKELIRRFKEDKSPRFEKECEYYCEYFRRGICSGRHNHGT